MLENDNKDLTVEFYFKEKGIKPRDYKVEFNESEIMGYSLQVTYTTNENPEPQKIILSQRDRENLLARRILRIEREVLGI